MQNQAPFLPRPVIGTTISMARLSCCLPCFRTRVPGGPAAVRLVMALLLWVSPSQAGVREIGPIGLTVANLDQEVQFYTRVLSFEKVFEKESPHGAADGLLGLDGTQLRSAELKLGDERITLTKPRPQAGRPIPADSRSFDHWFQHLAIVVRDIDLACEHLRRAKVKPISTAPQTLPAWNQNAAGIRAFYFRDPEDHVLELLWFPPGKGDPRWQRPSTNLFLGIDHTAIVVSDTDRSLPFYRDTLGLKVAGGSENYGTEQEHLNQVFGARVRITSLRAPRGPGIEFLEYLTPPGGRPLPPDAKASDLVFWHTRLVVDELDDLLVDLRQLNSVMVSSRLDGRPDGNSRSSRECLTRDPDGHALHLLASPKDPQGH